MPKVFQVLEKIQRFEKGQIKPKRISKNSQKTQGTRERGMRFSDEERNSINQSKKTL